MAKLRKMLGSADAPETVALMRAIETQSRETLARWALDCAEQRYLPLIPRSDDAGMILYQTAAAVNAYLSGELPLKALKPLLADARKTAAAISNPVAQAAARAASTAFAVIQTPTNALGFTFYGTAAYAYQTAGSDADAATYDRLAAEESTALLESLKAVSVPGETDPVRIRWNC